MNRIEIHGSTLLQTDRKYTIEEYVELETASVEKHEYYKGDIFAMSGGKLKHNMLAVNLIVALANRLKGKPCQPYNSDTRIHIKKNSLFTYPDVSVFCGDPESLNDDEYNFLNPTVIFEVLSPSTRDYDRTTKFQLYRDIPSLKMYVLAEPEYPFIEAFHINAQGFWELHEYKNLEQTLLLPVLQTELPLVAIYQGIKQHSAGGTE